MSWELMSDEKRICSCGKGFVIDKRYMDDWNRTRQECYLECKYCREKQLKEQNKREEMRISCDKIVSYFNETYLDQWIAFFKNMKNKKSIWEMSSALKLEYCSLSTFYTQHRSSPTIYMNEYYKSLVQIQNIPTLIQVLGIKDEIIDNTLPDLLDFYEEERRKGYNEAYAHYRKKI